MSYEFSNTSQERLNTCHKDLIAVANLALKLSDVDFGIAEGQRPLSKQREYFEAGKSKLNPDNPEHLKRAKHVISEYRMNAEAFDIYAWINGANYETHNMAYLAGVILTASKILYQMEVITHKVRWGGNWNSNGEIITDQSFDDLVHFELITE